MVNAQYKNSELTGRVIGCAMEVHNNLGNGFAECIYQKALSLELTSIGLNHEREVIVPIFYKGTQVGTRRVDFLVQSILSVEIKAVALLDDNHLAQAINYLEAFRMEIGLLINFGSKSLQFRRLVNSKLPDNRLKTRYPNQN